MVLDDCLIERMDAAAIDRVLRPKVAGAANLEAAAADLSLDYLLIYSSATTYFGNPGQFNYVAANGFLEGLARRMQMRGIPAYAVAWGAIEDAGYLARNIASDAALRGKFSGNFIPAGTALEALEAAWNDTDRSTPSFAIARIDWTVARRALAALRAPAFGSVAADGGHRPSPDATAVLESLKGRPVEEVVETLTEIVAGEIARVLRLPLKEVDHHRNLADIGMDSLMMLELRMTVESSLQIELPMLSLSSGITPAEIARRVAPLVTGHAEQNVPSKIVALSTSHISRDAEESDTELRDAALGALMSKVHEMDRTS
jgi:acyl carrier protein